MNDNQKLKLLDFVRPFLLVICCFCGFMAFACVVAVSSNKEMTADSRIQNIIFGIFCFIVFVASLVAYIWIKKQTQAIHKKREAERQAVIDNYLRLGLKDLPIVPFPSTLVPKPGEICYWHCGAASSEEKVVTTGYTGGGAGVSVRVAKGVTLHTSSGRSRAIKQKVTQSYWGEFIITNQRVILKTQKGGFEKALSRITFLECDPKGLSFQFGSTAKRVLLGSSPIPHHIIRLLLAAK